MASRGLAFRFSRNGIPAFSCSEKPAWFGEQRGEQDFLWADGIIPGVVQGHSATAWWQTFKAMAMGDRSRWARVQKSMAKAACLVVARSKPGAGWVEISPSPECLDLNRNSGRDVPPSVESHGTRAGRGTGKPGSSLRFEVLRN